MASGPLDNVSRIRQLPHGVFTRTRTPGSRPTRWWANSIWAGTHARFLPSTGCLTPESPCDPGTWHDHTINVQVPQPPERQKYRAGHRLPLTVKAAKRRREALTGPQPAELRLEPVRSSLVRDLKFQGRRGYRMSPAAGLGSLYRSYLGSADPRLPYVARSGLTACRPESRGSAVGAQPAVPPPSPRGRKGENTWHQKHGCRTRNTATAAGRRLAEPRERQSTATSAETEVVRGRLH